MLPLGSLGLPTHFFPFGGMAFFSIPTPICQLLEFAPILGLTYSPPIARLLPTIHRIQYCSYKLFSENPPKIAKEQLLLWYFQKEEICISPPQAKGLLVLHRKRQMKSFTPAEICVSLTSTNFNVWISGQKNGKIVLEEKIQHLLQDCSFASHIFATDIYK